MLPSDLFTSTEGASVTPGLGTTRITRTASFTLSSHLLFHASRYGMCRGSSQIHRTAQAGSMGTCSQFARKPWKRPSYLLIRVWALVTIYSRCGLPFRKNPIHRERLQRKCQGLHV